MIISASRRTDIPAFYSDWFFQQINMGNCYVQTGKELKEISLKPDDVDCFVFWTKNATPMLNKLDKLKDYMYYFQYTITPYEKEIEPNLNKEEAIKTFKILSDKIGKNRIIWRFDPIFLSAESDFPKYTLNHIVNEFARLCYHLSDYTEKVVISFIDMYGLFKDNPLCIRQPYLDEIKVLAYELSKIALRYELKIETCAEYVDLESYGIQHGHCINKEYIEKLIGRELVVGKDSTQRRLCGCCESIDIGWYNTCKHGCIYCYANQI